MGLDILDFVDEELIIAGAQPADKQELCRMMVRSLIENGRITADREEPLLEKLMERESLSSTGIGGSVAIPHASGEAIEKMMVVVAQVPGGVDFDSIDDEPVRIAFMIIGSQRSPRTHLQLLATIVRICKDGKMIEKMISAGDRHELFELLRTHESN